MLCRMRLRSGIYVSGMLMMLGVALAAHATQVVTESQMQAYVLTVIGSAGVVVFAAFWILLKTISSMSEKAVAASIERLEEAVAGFAETLANHDSYRFAHAAASEHNHRPLEQKIDKIREELDEFIEWCHGHECPAISKKYGIGQYKQKAEQS